MRRALKLLLLLGVGLAFATTPKGGDADAGGSSNKGGDSDGDNRPSTKFKDFDADDVEGAQGQIRGHLEEGQAQKGGESEGSIDPRDIHDAFRESYRDVDVDRVWSEGEMYFQEDGQIVKILDNGDGTYQVVVKDPSNLSGLPTTVIEALTENQFQQRLDSERWFE